MNSTPNTQQRKESDRQGEKKWYSALFVRPEIGPFGVMFLLFILLGYFSIPQGEFSLNPFAGEGFNALGIRNNFRVIAQLGIVALGAGMLIIAGEFDSFEDAHQMICAPQPGQFLDPFCPTLKIKLEADIITTFIMDREYSCKWN